MGKHEGDGNTDKPVEKPEPAPSTGDGLRPDKPGKHEKPGKK
ncbi:hypothetical protein [Streptosporangium sp. KLBMP 9127]